MIQPLAALLSVILVPGLRGPSGSALPLIDVFVDAAGNCSTGTGTVNSPVCSIGDAIALASSGDTIRIAPGTYVENVVLGLDLDLIGTGGAAVTTIDGGAQGSVITIPAAVTVRLEGLTLTNGLALEGGGVNCLGDLTLVNSTIRGNTATGTIGGGGIGSLYGGANVRIEGSTVEYNVAVRGNGGGIESRGAQLTILDSVFQYNEAYAYGGGVFFDDGDTGYPLEIDGSWISSNRVLDGFGGGVEIVEGLLVMTNSTVSGNSSIFGGGGIECIRGSLDLRNSTLSGNSSGYGGGLNVFGSFYPISLSFALSHMTIVDNESLTVTGGGIQNSSNFSIDLINTIVADNRVPAGYGFGRDLSGMFTTLGHNLVGSGAFGVTDGVNGDRAGSPNAPLDPGLFPLTLLDGGPPVHALVPTSPAFDGGDAQQFEALDQLGRMRPQGAAPDIGAVEGGLGSDRCLGDGGDGMGCTPCPCGNDAPVGSLGGCLNSSGVSMRLLRFGTSSVSLSDLRFEGRGAPSLSAALLLSSATLAPANPANPCFGLDSGIQAASLDGLRCVVAGTQRHGSRAADANGEIGVTNAGWGDGDNFVGFAAFVAGETRSFQVIYRDNPEFVCQTGLNSSQASRVTFVP